MQRGRKAADDTPGALPIALVPAQKPEPPEELTLEEAEEWKRYVGRMPADWFTAEVQPVLVELCRHRCLSRKAAEALHQVGPLRSKASVEAFVQLSRAHTEQSKMVVTLSTKLRLTPQSRYATKPAYNAVKSSIRKPWEPAV